MSSFGDPLGTDASIPIVFEDRLQGICKKIHVSADGRRLLGGPRVGDASS